MSCEATMLKTKAKLTMLLILAAGLVHFGTAQPLDAQTLASAHTDAVDPFKRINADLAQAADLYLERVRESAHQATEKPPGELNWQTQSDSPRGVLAGVSPERLAIARQRLRALGVDGARIFAEEGIPEELLVVAEIESNYNPLALSPKGARGVWQLMPETATRFGLRVDGQIDERIHPARSTRAAARYLRELYVQFGDWFLALAAYNTGEARVLDAIRRTRSRDFRRLTVQRSLPEETRRYVPAVLGLTLAD